MKTLFALLLSASVATGGCTARASAGLRGPGSPPSAAVNAGLMRDYIRQLPVGSRVRLVRADGTVMRALLMKNDGDPIVVQRRARIPEPPIEIAVRDIAAMEPEPGNGGNTGRSIAIGAAAAAAATLGVLMLLAAIFAD